MYDGLEIDVLSLGDADCSIVTKWVSGIPHRILIDGGCGQDSEAILEFLRRRGYTSFWAAVCTHKHNDHASGLIKLIESSQLTFYNGWMHDMRRHIAPDVLRRVSASDSSIAAARDVTERLSKAFTNRKIPIHEPFAGECIAGYPNIFVLGPSVPFYEKALKEFIDADLRPENNTSLSALIAASHALGGLHRPLGSLGTVPTGYSALSSLSGGRNLPALTGLLANSSVQVAPKTQPFNSTSVILGIRDGACKMLLTADAGTEALACVSAEWNHLTYLGVPHHGSDGNLSQRDIERFCPQFAIISAKGDASHPSRSIVNGLVKVGAKVASTHRSGHLQFSFGAVPPRSDYGVAELLTGSSLPDSRALVIKALSGVGR